MWLCSSSLDNIEPLCFAEAFPPTFLTRPEPITTFVGKSAKFLCTVSGTPVIDITWQKDGTTISPSDHHKISKVENKHVLEISLLTASDRGVYTCKASNKFGADICQTEMYSLKNFHIPEPKKPPVFDQPLQPAAAEEGDTLQLSCHVQGSQPIRVQWLKAGKEIRASDRCNFSFANGVALLELAAVTKSDSGEYVCKASNRIQIPFQAFVLALQITLWADLLVKHFSLAIFNPSSNGGSPITNYIVEKRDVRRKGWQTVDTTVKDTKYTVSPLTEGSLYVFRVAAENAIGQSDYCEIEDSVLAKDTFSKF
uniref:Uncharacterized protein n=1 Tax=Ficedula albicollis TaxID=59894 RepID=A0A803W5I1_FICAL